MNESDSVPNRTVKRRRNPGISLAATVPGHSMGQKQMTAEEWQEDQNKKQLQHARGWVEARKRERAEAEARTENIKNAGEPKAGHGVLDEAHNAPVIPPDPGELPAPRNLKVPARGPVIDTEGKVIDEGDVPIARNRSKKVSKVAEARRKAKLSKVLG